MIFSVGLVCIKKNIYKYKIEFEITQFLVGVTVNC